MKKLNLQLDSIKEMLTKEQMKKIVGGYGGDGGCTDSCTSDSSCGTGYQCASLLCTLDTYVKTCVPDNVK